MIIITMGTYDLFHIGHLNILKYLKTYNCTDNCQNKLIVGVSTDAFNFNKKNRYPIQNESQRYEIVKSIKYVDEVFFEESMELKKNYILKYNADIFAIGDDWKGSFDYLEKIKHPNTNHTGICKVIYIPRTPSISTSVIIEKIKCNY
jgi:glycerol-3-phosphate cytidylyltransferase